MWPLNSSATVQRLLNIPHWPHRNPLKAVIITLAWASFATTVYSNVNRQLLYQSQLWFISSWRVSMSVQTLTWLQNNIFCFLNPYFEGLMMKLGFLCIIYETKLLVISEITLLCVRNLKFYFLNNWGLDMQVVLFLHRLCCPLGLR